MAPSRKGHAITGTRIASSKEPERKPARSGRSRDRLCLNMASRMREYLDPDEGFHVQRICDALAVGRGDFAHATHRTSQDLHRYFGKSASYTVIKTDEVRRVLNELVVLLELLLDLVRDPEKIRYWMRLPNPGFDNNSPIDLVRDGKTTVVINELHALATGDVPR